MIIGILSDSHITVTQLKSEGYPKLLKTLKTIFKDVDHIIHVGDICIDQFIDDMATVTGKPISAVAGNMDFDTKWPKKLTLEFEGINIGITHYLNDITTFPEKSIRVFIYGHTHLPSIKDSPQGVLMINPGSLLKPRTKKYFQGFSEETIARPSVAFLNLENGLVSAFIKKL
ncbi:MAG: metallophosphoesterase family protein [Promethearchaeota archaeon]